MYIWKYECQSAKQLNGMLSFKEKKYISPKPTKKSA